MLYVIGQIFKEKELVGYRILDVIAKKAIDIQLDKIRAVLSKGADVTFENAYYKPDSGILIGTQGSLTSYQKIYANGVLFGKKKIAICYGILDSDTKELGGYGVTDGYGMLVNVKLDKFLSLCSKYDASNFELRQLSNGKFKVVSLGEEFKNVEMKLIQAKKGYNSKLGEKDVDVCSEVKDSNQSNMLPTINVYSYNDIKNNEFAISAQDKLFKALLNMKKLSPYYHTILMSIKREVSTAIDTMAVSEDTLYYNFDFVNTLTVAEITFVLIHEICHIAMRHSVRHGNKDNVLWNIATDLYINSIISRDFNCHYGGSEVEVSTPLGNAYIKVLDGGVHLSTIGETLDFGVDTPESIYARLVKENPPQQGQDGGGSGQQSSSSQNSQQGQDSQQQQGQDSSGQSQGQSQDSKQGQGQGQGQGEQQQQNGDSQSGQGQGQEQGNQQGQDSIQGDSVSTDKSSLSEESQDVDQKDDYKKGKKVSVTYNGKKLEGTVSMDVITSEIGDTKERNDRMNSASLNATQGMKTAIEVAKEKTGTDLVKNAGAGCGLVQRCIEFGLATKVNWRVVLKNMCLSKPKKMYTMGSPNEVYMNSGVTVASRRKIGKPTTIKGIKICIDVSGSISERELNYYLSECNNILNHYEVEGELIYWSTMIGDAGKFSDLKDMLKVQPNSTGGTDVKCVFDYLARKTRVNSKYEETPIKDISCVLIFTDGCFNNNYEEYARYFGKKVVWVVPDSRFMFNPPFGKIACMD